MRSSMSLCGRWGRPQAGQALVSRGLEVSCSGARWCGSLGASCVHYAVTTAPIAVERGVACVEEEGGCWSEESIRDETLSRD